MMTVKSTVCQHRSVITAVSKCSAGTASGTAFQTAEVSQQCWLLSENTP